MSWGIYGGEVGGCCGAGHDQWGTYVCGHYDVYALYGKEVDRVYLHGVGVSHYLALLSCVYDLEGLSKDKNLSIKFKIERSALCDQIPISCRQKTSFFFYHYSNGVYITQSIDRKYSYQFCLLILQMDKNIQVQGLFV